MMLHMEGGAMTSATRQNKTRPTHKVRQSLVRGRNERVVAEYYPIEFGEVLELHSSIFEDTKIDLDEPTGLPHAFPWLELDKCTRDYGEGKK